ncbi:MAG: HAD family hydrolase [Methanomassiliicoccales archaeon]
MCPIRRNSLRPNGLKAVIFDMDGTLIRTTIDFRKMNQGVAETLLQHGLPRDILDPSGKVNESIVRAYSYFKVHSQDGWAEALEKDLNRVSLEVEMARVNESREIPGTADTLRYLRSKGIRTAVLTRGSRAYTEKALSAAGLEDKFEIVLCRDDHPLTEAKPNPLALRRVYDSLGLKGGECLFIGDHETDLLCAQGAGSPFAAVLTGTFSEEMWEPLGPDVIMDSVAELPWLLEGLE